MSKPVFAMLLGGVLGVFDGLTALVSGGPEIPSQIGAIVAGSTFKGVVAGLIVGLVARKTQATAVLVAVGLAVGALFAYLVTIGTPYFWEIVLPGSIVGLIVGFGLGAAYCFAEYFFTRGSYDNDGIDFRTPWTGRKTERGAICAARSSTLSRAGTC